MPTTTKSPTPKYLERAAVVIWLIVAAVVCVRAYVWPHRHSILPIYTTAAANWQAGQDTYALQPGLPDLYRYSPTAAVLLAPMSLLPDNLAGLLWRLLNLTVFFAGIIWWCQAVVSSSATISSGRWAVFGILLL